MKTLLLSLMMGLAFALLPPEILKGDPAKLIMPFLGLFMAGIFPAITLTVNSIKSGGFSVKRVSDLAVELSKLLNYLQALFVVALISAISLVSAEAMHWGKGFAFPFYTSRVFNFILGSCFGFLVLALPKIRRAFSTLLNIGRDIAIDEASSKVRDKMSKLPSIVDRFPTKEKFGELFEASPMHGPKN